MSHIYVCHFSNGTIKVGRSESPDKRIKQHEERVACVGVSLVEYSIFKCAGNPVLAESELIKLCVINGAVMRNSLEWFVGLNFKIVEGWAEQISKTACNFVDSKNINDKVKNLIAAGFTQTELAEAIGVSQPTISDLFNGVQKDIGIERGGRKIDALHALHCDKKAA